MRYRVLRGINYPPGNKRAEPGAVVDDLSQKSARALLALDPPAIERIYDSEPDGDVEGDG